MKTMIDFQDMKFPQRALRKEAINQANHIFNYLPKNVEGIKQRNIEFIVDKKTRRDDFFFELGKISGLFVFFNLNNQDLINGI